MQKIGAVSWFCAGFFRHIMILLARGSGRPGRIFMARRRAQHRQFEGIIHCRTRKGLAFSRRPGAGWRQENMRYFLECCARRPSQWRLIRRISKGRAFLRRLQAKAPPGHQAGRELRRLPDLPEGAGRFRAEDAGRGLGAHAPDCIGARAGLVFMEWPEGLYPFIRIGGQLPARPDWRAQPQNPRRAKCGAITL